jgi:hypothetical protein
VVPDGFVMEKRGQVRVSRTLAEVDLFGPGLGQRDWRLDLLLGAMVQVMQRVLAHSLRTG